MSGSESYESLQISFSDAWNEINEVIADGEVEIKSGQKVQVELFLGGDYKVCIIDTPVSMHLSIELSIEHIWYNFTAKKSDILVYMNIFPLLFSFFFLSVEEVQQIPIMPASGARYINRKDNKSNQKPCSIS